MSTNDESNATAINLNVDDKTIVKDAATNKFKVNIVAEKPLVSSGDKGDTMELNFDDVTMKNTDGKLGMNY